MFVAGRVFIDTRYLIKYAERNEYLAMFSSDGNEELRADYASKNDLEGAATAHCKISGHWYRPLLDSNQKLIGTKIFYLNESEFGGNVP